MSSLPRMRIKEEIFEIRIVQKGSMSRMREIHFVHGSSYLRERVTEYLHLLYLHLCMIARVRGIAFRGSKIEAAQV
jgi:hypothetical protein